MTLTRGQRVRVTDLGVGDTLALGLGTRPAGFEVVVAGLEEDETLVDRAFLLSRHQPASFEGSVAIGQGTGGDTVGITVHLGRVPASVHTLRIALVGDVRLSADDLQEAWLRVLADGHQTARWSFTGADLSGERAIIVADVYRRDGWRMVFHGTGYRAGLRAFLERIEGGTRLPGAPEEPDHPPAPPAGPAPADAPFPPPPGVGSPGPPAPPAAPPSPAGPGWAGPAGPAPAGTSAGWAPPSTEAAGAPPRPSGGGGGRRSLRTGLTFRERLFSVPVGKALVSPSGLGLAAGGAVVGGAGAGLALSGAAIALGAIGLGGVAWLGRGLAAMPGQRGEKIDPFALREPWRHFVRDALAAHDTFQRLVKRTPEGPLRDRLAQIGERLEEGLRECWTIAARGDSLREARLAIDDASVRAELAQLHATPGAHDPGSRARLAEALQSQVDAATRLDRVIDATYDQLRLLDARMDNAVARALEISATAGDSASVGTLGAEVDGLVDDLEALRQGLEEIRGVQPG